MTRTFPLPARRSSSRLAVRCALVVGAVLLAASACGSEDAPPAIDRTEVGCGATDFSVCGYAFDELTDEVGRPAYTSPFATTLPRWSNEELCQGVVQRGRCADGKDFLYWRLGDAAEVRYYDAEGRPTAVAQRRAESTCGDPCPRESFYGTLEALRCDMPSAGALCGAGVRLTTADMPFSEGIPTVPCAECDAP
jgi:hypothetical protein